MAIDELTRQIIRLAMRVHTGLGPGLFESVYGTCLCYELSKASLSFERQVKVPLLYRSVQLQSAFIADLIVENAVLLEIKSVKRLEPVHGAQLLTYLRLSAIEVGLLINFNVPHLRDGIVRRITKKTSVTSVTSPILCVKPTDADQERGPDET